MQAVGRDHPFLIQSVEHPEQVKDFLWAEHLKHGGGAHITYTKPAIETPSNIANVTEDDEDEDGSDSDDEA